MPGNSFYKSFLNVTLIIFSFSLIFSCASAPPPLPDSISCRDFPFDPVSPNITHSVLSDYPLTYSSVIKDGKNQPFFRIGYEYIGRCPDLSRYEAPNAPYPGPDYRLNRISFYHRSFANLTDSPIILKKVTTRQLFQNDWTRYDVDKDGNKVAVKVPAVSFRDYSERPSRRGNVIKPLEVRDSGSWCYSTSGEVWLFDLIVEFKGEEYTIQYHRVGH